MDLSADRHTDGQWVVATAVFNNTVTGTVTLVRATDLSGVKLMKTRPAGLGRDWETATLSGASLPTTPPGELPSRMYPFQKPERP